jgi:ribosome-binding protein aMBF1 (putative translation factor)
MVAMWGEVEIEPEVREWFLALDETDDGRVRFHVDRLAGSAERNKRSAHGDRRGVRLMAKRTSWDDIKAERPLTEEGRAAYEDEARISAFRAMVYRLRTDARLTQAELADRMGTTQSAIARMEGGGARPTLETLEKLAAAVGGELVVGVGENLSDNRSIAKLVRDGHAVIRRVS